MNQKQRVACSAMGRMKKTLFAAITVLSVAALAVPVATALTIDIDDRTETLTISVDGVVQPAAACTIFVGLEESCTFGIFAIQGVFPGIQQFGFNIFDPGTGLFSDFFILLIGQQPNQPPGTSGFSFLFNSDLDGVPCTVDRCGNPHYPSIVESGDFQTVFDAFAADQENELIIRFASNPESTVPEPATLALLGIGLAGVGFSRRRKLN